jgi:hypothetical protein
MKIRVGFVSNSSSSSYIVTFTQLAMDHNIMQCLDCASTLSPISKRIHQIEGYLQDVLDWCKEDGINPDTDEEAMMYKKRIARLEKEKDRTIYVEMDRGDGERTVTDLLDLLKIMGLVKSYESEY